MVDDSRPLIMPAMIFDRSNINANDESEIPFHPEEISTNMIGDHAAFELSPRSRYLRHLESDDPVISPRHGGGGAGCEHCCRQV